MRVLPITTDRDEFDALVIRTDYRDEQAWQVLKAALTESGEGGAHFIDDPAWSEASVDEVLAAVTSDEELAVVFLVDGTTMQADHHALLAVTVSTPQELDDEDYAALIEFGREFRTLPSGVYSIHANLQLANMGFEEFAEAAQNDPEGVFRSF